MKTFFIGIDIGGTRTKSGLVNITTGEIIETIVLPTEKKDQHRFMENLAMVVAAFRTTAAKMKVRVAGIGIGIPGFVNQEGVVVTTYGFLDFMESYPLKNLVEENFSLGCCLDNDARTVALGEALYGKGKNYSRVLTVTLGTGVGLGFVVDGNFPELAPLAHMAGHMKITDGGERCYCGKTGCLEALVASGGIINLARKNNLASLSSVEAIIESALAGNAGAAEVMEKVTGWLHIAVHNYVNLYAPDMVVLGGGIAKGLACYLDKIKGNSYLSPYTGYSFQLQVSELQEHAGILGSAALCRPGML